MMIGKGRSWPAWLCLFRVAKSQPAPHHLMQGNKSLHMPSYCLLLPPGLLSESDGVNYIVNATLCDTGRWWHAGGHLATTIATPAAYAPLPFAVSRLGWPAGMIALIVGTMVTMYTSCLLASLHRHNGRRYTRYRDLAYSIVGKRPVAYTPQRLHCCSS